MTQLYPPATAADTTHAKASAAKRLRSSRLIATNQLSYVITVHASRRDAVHTFDIPESRSAEQFAVWSF
jgi:hypothetical protein